MAQAAKSRKTLRKLAKVAGRLAKGRNKCANKRPGKKKNGPFSFLTEKKVTYHRDVAKERKQLKAAAMADRKERLAIQQLRAKEKAAEAAILAAEKKIAQAEKGIDTAAKKAKGGGMSESQFDAIKARMQREIDNQEEHKKKVQAGNPSWGYGIYQGAGFAARQLAHFKSKQGAEAYARVHGLKDYSIKRAFAKNPAVSGSQYRLAQAVLSGTQRVSSMPKKVAQEIVDSTPAALRSKYMMEPLTGGKNPGEISIGHRKLKASWLPGRWVLTRDGHYNTPHGGSVRLKAGQLTSKVARDEHGRVWGLFSGHVVDVSGNITQQGVRQNSTGGTKANKSRGKINRGSSKKQKQSKRNPEDLAAKLSEKFHGRPASTFREVNDPAVLGYRDKALTELGALVRLVIDTPTQKVAVLNFNLTDPKKIVRLVAVPVKDKTGKVISRQLLFVGGDQEVNLKALGMDDAPWIRDQMELGRLHHFKHGEPVMLDGEKVRGSITYQARKGFNDFKLTDWWHKAGEETERIAGPAARSLVIYDHRNKHLSLAGGNYHVDSPGVIN